METAAVNPAIDFTFEEESHAYRAKQGGKRILSVTQVLESAGLIDYAGAPQAALDYKSDIGTAVHSAVHALATPSEGELNWETVDPRCTPYIVGFEKFVEETGWTASLVEYQNCVKLQQGEVGFKTDQVGLIGGLSAVLEVKCTLDPENSWPIQLAGYVQCLLALGFKPQGSPAYKRLAVQLKPDATYKLHIFDERSDLYVWQWALALATWKANHGYNFEKR